MIFDLDGEQLAWRDEVRAFLGEAMTDELVAEIEELGFETFGPEQRAFWKAVGARGWLSLTWPKEFGGRGKGPSYQQILIHEFEYAGAHRPGLEVTSLAPMIMRYGTRRNQEDWLPLIASGELVVAVGYSEPNAGTDLASLRTSAVLDGDGPDAEWVINGQKIWNSYAHMASHEWLCVRTDPTAPKHQGISVIIVPIDTPGIEVRPLITWSDMRTNEAFFTDVRVPRENLIGEVNQGWRYITGALDLERGAVSNAGGLRRTVDDLIAAAKATLPDGRRPADDPDIRRRITQLDAEADICCLMSLEAASLLESGEIPTMTVTAFKVFSTELRQRIADVATQVLGPYGVLTGADAPWRGHFEKLYREAPLMRFGGGTNEVLRDSIARRGHAMPGYGR